jgi:hypothetical protein
MRRNRRAIARAYRVRREWRWTPRALRATLIAGAALIAIGLVIAFMPAMAQAVKAATRHTIRPQSRAGPAAPARQQAAKSHQTAKVDTGETIARSFSDGDPALAADKHTSRLYLFRSAAGRWLVEDSFPVATGANQGPKTSKGDKRTPEGVYFIIGRRDHTELASIYGPFAYMLDYPSEVDRAMGKTGDGIWIHGTAPDSSPIDTRGCLELHNRNLIAISRLLKSGIGTPVAIVDSLRQNAADSLFGQPRVEARHRLLLLERQSLRDTLAGVLDKWRLAWQSRDMPAYAAFYDTAHFRGQGVGWFTWRRTKERTFADYDSIAVAISDVGLIELSDTTATVRFLQRYASDRTRSDSWKKIAFERYPREWKIIRETTAPNEENGL